MKAVSFPRERSLSSRAFVGILAFAMYWCVFCMDASADGGRAANIIRPTPYFVSGKQAGYRLYPGSYPATYEAMGLQPGDLLFEMDGRATVEPRAIFELFERLDSGNAVNVRVRRDYEVVSLLLQIRW